jgi:hypothetical protein
MSSLAPPSDLLAQGSYIDGDELSGLERIRTIYEVGENSVVVETSEGREIRINVWLDRAAGQYVADFERRATITSGQQQLRVWAHTPAYARCVGDDVLGCLHAAIVAVDRVPVF